MTISETAKQIYNLSLAGYINSEKNSRLDERDILMEGGNHMKTNTLIPVIKAILNDEEFLCGGIFTKEKQYAKKYDLTMEEIGNIQTCLYYALHIKDECYNERINHICD